MATGATFVLTARARWGLLGVLGWAVQAVQLKRWGLDLSTVLEQNKQMYCSCLGTIRCHVALLPGS